MTVGVQIKQQLLIHFALMDVFFSVILFSITNITHFDCMYDTNLYSAQGCM